MDDTEILSSLAIGSSTLSFGDAKGGFWKSAAVTLGLQGSSEIFDGFGSVLQLDDMHLEGNTDREDVSLVVGKLVTKDLYIGYDINMFNQLGEFRVRYDLDSGFFAETRSSTESTGADLLYIFEK
jgi:translocation and assembly module TamB